MSSQLIFASHASPEDIAGSLSALVSAADKAGLLHVGQASVGRVFKALLVLLRRGSEHCSAIVELCDHLNRRYALLDSTAEFPRDCESDGLFVIEDEDGARLAAELWPVMGLLGTGAAEGGGHRPSERIRAKETQLGRLPCGSAFASSSMQGWRATQEDAHICGVGFDPDHPDRHLFAVFDGHGGSRVSRYLADHLPRRLLDTAAYLAGDFDAALTSAFLSLDSEMPDARSVGSTAVAALLAGGRIHVANVGDSRAVVSDSGAAVDLSVDHKPEDEVELSRILAAGGHVTDEGRVNGDLNLSRALGDHAYKRNSGLGAGDQIISPVPDLRTLDIAPSHQFLLIACDGVWNCVTSQEAVDFCAARLARGLGPDRVLEELLDRCFAEDPHSGIAATHGTGCDNVTAVLVCLRADHLLHE